MNDMELRKDYKAMSKAWNRCDVCGKFISFADFDSGKAIRQMLTPDSHYTAETYETLCGDHNDRNPWNDSYVQST